MPTETSIARRTDAWWHSNARTGRFGALLGRSLEIHFGSKQTSLPRQRPARSKQRSVLLQPMCAASFRGSARLSRCARSQTEVCFASADVRGLVQGVCTLQPMCAASFRGSARFSRCAQPRSGGLHASADVRGLVQGVCTLQPMCASQTEVCLTSIPTDSDGSNARHRVKPSPSTRHSFLF